MGHRYVAVFFILGIGLAGNFSLTQSCKAETLVQSIVESRVLVALHVGQAELQKRLPTPWQINPIPGGPLKGANFMLVFIDSLLVQDGQGRPDMGGIDRIVSCAVPAKHAHTGEMASVVIGGFHTNSHDVPGPYKTWLQGTIRREQTHKGADLEAGVGDDFWQVRDNRGSVIELRLQYKRALPARAKSEIKVYSAVEPTFFRTYRVDSTTDLVKSMPAGIDRVQNYQLHVAVPELSKLFDGTEQFVGISVIPFYLRQVFLP